MKKRILLLIFIVAFSFLNIVGCSQIQTEKQATYQTISTETAKKRLDLEKGIVLLGVFQMDLTLLGQCMLYNP